jgi:hypothetical protein
MRGLRYPESEKFENFFTMVQSTMYKSNCVFFLDTGNGNEFETEFMEGEELVGWVIPINMADEFEAKFMAEECLDEYCCHYYHIDWGANPRHLKIRCHRCDAE